jgi:hypothetical protein
MSILTILGFACFGAGIYYSVKNPADDHKKLPKSLLLWFIGAGLLALSGDLGDGASFWEGNRSGQPSRYP